MTGLNRRALAGLAATGAAAVLLAACSSSGGDTGGNTTPAGSGGATTPTAAPADVTLQLQWVTQAQFAGYIAALKQGFYNDQNLNVTIVPAGTDTVPQTTVDDGGTADFAIAWVPKALQSREQGANITDVGQVFQRSGTLQVAMKDSGITGPEDLKGKVVGDWGFGNEYELFAGMTQAGLDPGKDVEIVQQQFDMNAFLAGDIDAAQAMIYNEYAQVLEAENPDTGELYQPSDLNVINWNDVGTAMLQDAIWANTTKLQDPAFQDVTVRFLTASYQGWIYCATNPEECRDMVVQAGSKLGASHQLWQVNEINKLIWPAPAGAGSIEDADWNKTVQIARTAVNADGQTVLTKDPDAAAKNTTYVQKALEILKGQGVDVVGANYKPETVQLTENGS
jgi:NitT/TauT family transport system substrate-binding protein